MLHPDGQQVMVALGGGVFERLSALYGGGVAGALVVTGILRKLNSTQLKLVTEIDGEEFRALAEGHGGGQGGERLAVDMVAAMQGSDDIVRRMQAIACHIATSQIVVIQESISWAEV